MTTTATDVDLGGGYVGITSAPEPGVFEIGLVLAGAVSAGAYTAGVIDFLIEALDTWEAQKVQCAKSNPDPRTWNIPGHRVRLRVVSGASAGAMTAAISSVALGYQFQHVHPGADGSHNPLYKPWVKDIDISKLLQTQDFTDANAPVVSLLDSSALLTILQAAMDYKGPATQSRPYLDKSVRFIFTEGNLRGIPYFLAMQGNTLDGLGMLAHSDFQSFLIGYGGSGGTRQRADDITPAFPNNFNDANWHALGMAALSSGAFPIGLAPRVITRKGTDFDYRFVVVPGDQDTSPPQIACLKPQWSAQSCGAPNPYTTAVVDGGTMDNEPLELARTDLAGLLGRNPRNGELANRATLLIDPFPDLAGTIDAADRGQKLDILNAGIGLMGAWKDQARFDPVDLALAGDENTFSRFLVAPDRGNSPGSNGFALACGALGGFSGFLAERYRHHDYMLGRRNCQQFLRTHFCLPTLNEPVFQVVNPQLKEKSQWLVPSPQGPCLPIIPLMDALSTEEPLVEWPSGVFQPDSLRSPISARLSVVADRVLRTSVHLNWFWRTVAKLGLARVESTAVDKVIQVIQQELKVRALVQ